MVWTSVKISWPLHKDHARHSTCQEQKGKQNKRWEYNIKEWTDLDFKCSQGAAEDRQIWRNTVADVISGVPATRVVAEHR